MAFTKMAVSECKSLKAQNVRANMHDRGWYETRVEPVVLDELGLDYEIGPRVTVLAWPPPLVYAPVWVHGIWLRIEAENRSAILRILLEKARDDLNEREMICTELALDVGVSRSVRETAQAYAELVRQVREKEQAHEHPQ